MFIPWVYHLHWPLQFLLFPAVPWLPGHQNHVEFHTILWFYLLNKQKTNAIIHTFRALHHWIEISTTNNCQLIKLQYIHVYRVTDTVYCIPCSLYVYCNVHCICMYYTSAILLRKRGKYIYRVIFPAKTFLHLTLASPVIDPSVLLMSI